MIGGDAIGLHAIGEMVTDAPQVLMFEPVSRLASGAYSAGVQLAELGVGIEWDNGDILVWDDDSDMGWEA